MINIKELSIGNWVYNKHHSKAIQITPFDFFAHTHRDGEQYLIGSPNLVSGKDFEPIPISPEILEKNGFEKREFINEVNCKEEYWIYCDDYYSLVISEINDRLYKVEHHSEELINLIGQLYISYVHQLQNALTLCGINKEIEL